MVNARLLFLLIYFFCTVTIAAGQKTDNIHFLSLADIHFDPFIVCYKPGLVPCPLIQKLQRAPANKWRAILNESDNGLSYYRQDTSYALLKITLSASKQAVQLHQVKFVVILGDFLGHDYRKYYKKYSQDKTRTGYESFVKKTMVFLTDELKTAFPEIEVYPVVGNNDSYGGDYSSDPNGLFFKDLISIWSPLIKNPNKRALQKLNLGGYYSVELDLPARVRLIALNTVLFSTKAKDHGIEQAAEAELTWLHEELASAKEKNQRVIIAMHIPPGIDIHLFRLLRLWKEPYIKRFEEELRLFSSDIAGVLAGHLHSDWFRILTNTHRTLIMGSPSVSPLFGNEPGFKLYTYLPLSGTVHDLKTYYYRANHKKYCRVEYDIRKRYNPNRMV